MATFNNYATLTYLNGSTVVSNTVTGEIIDNVVISKNALTTTYSTGTTLTYVVTLINSGTTALTGLTLTDNLGAYTYNGTTLYPLTYNTGTLAYYVDGSLMTAPTPTSTSPLTIEGISIPASANTTLIYQVTTNEYAPLDSTSDSIVNTATISGTGIEQALSATETVTPVAKELQIEKKISPSQIETDGEVTYTFVISNTGSQAVVATDNVVLTDTFNPILTLTGVSLNNTALTPTTQYTYNTTTGVFATVQGVITVPAATYTRNTDGSISVTPGTATLVVSGTV